MHIGIITRGNIKNEDIKATWLNVPRGLESASMPDQLQTLPQGKGEEN